MAKKVNIGPEISLDGEKEFKKAISSVNSDIRVLASEMKKTSEQFRYNQNTVEALSEKDKVLTGQVQKQKDKIDLLRKALESSKEQYGENDTRTDKWKVSLNNAEAELHKLNRQLDENKKSLQDAQNETKEMSSDMDRLGDEVPTEKMENFSDALKANVASRAIIDGVRLLADAFSDVVSEVGKLSIESGEAMSQFSAMTGTGKKEAKEYKKVIKSLYDENMGESMSDIAETMGTIKQQMKEIDADNIKDVTKNTIVLRDTFGFDTQEQLRAVNMLMDQFGISSEDAFNLITQGAQNGLDKNGDLLDSINEYAVHYKQMGVGAEGFFNSLANGTKSGTFSVDKLGDAYKEFGISVKDTAATTGEAYDLLGMDADKMRSAFAKGGKSAEQATQKVLKKLFSMEDRVKQNQVGVDLFGTMWEDLGIDGVKALTKVNGKIKTTSDALDEVAKIKYDSLDSALSGVGRQILSGVSEPIEERLLPKLQDMSDGLMDNCDGAKMLGETLADGLVWTLDHIDDIVDGVKALGTAFLAYKAVTTISAIVTGMQSMKTALEAATTAQKLFNLAQLGSPVGMIAAGAAALVAALVVFSSRARDAESDIGKLTKAEEENNKKIKEMNESYEELNENRKNAGEKIKVEYDDYEKLQVELDKIVDKNGKIKKGYEDRAKVITGELSEGLGVEIDIINGNTIPAYQKLRKEIKKTIALKEAEAMLNASKDSYVEARKNMKDAKLSYTDASNALDSLLSKRKGLAKEILSLKEQLADPDVFGQSNHIAKIKYVQLSNQLEKANSDSLALNDSIKKQRGVVDTAERTLQGYKTTISNYGRTTEAVAKKNGKAAKEAADDLVNEFITAKEGTKHALEEQRRVYESDYKKIKDAVKSGSEEITKADIKEAKNRFKKAEKECKKWEKLHKDAINETVDTAYNAATSKENKKKSEDTGKAIVTGVKRGMEEISPEELGRWFVEGIAKGISGSTSASILRTAVKDMANSIPNTVKLTLDEHSPSRVGIKLGAYFDEGLALGLLKNGQSAKAAEVISSAITSITKNDFVTGIHSGGYKFRKNTQMVSMSQESYVGKKEETVKTNNVGSGDLTLKVQVGSKEIFSTVYEEFRKAKKGDPTISMS